MSDPANHLSLEAKHKLEKSLKERPQVSELVDKNILKDPTVAPALQEKKAALERAQLEDRLDHALKATLDKREELGKEAVAET